jgi:SAM-dependent MidA family methyltransferase
LQAQRQRARSAPRPSRPTAVKRSNPNFDRAQATVHGPVPQSRLLLSLGIQARAQALAGAATEAAQVAALQAAYDRLVGGGAEGMGESYQALAITGPGLPPPVGFEGAAAE